MTTLANLRNRHTREGELLDQWEELERAKADAHGSRLAEIQRQIDRIESALADLGLREPGVSHPRYGKPLEPGYPLSAAPPVPAAMERESRLNALLHEGRIPATLEDRE